MATAGMSFKLLARFSSMAIAQPARRIGPRRMVPAIGQWRAQSGRATALAQMKAGLAAPAANPAVGKPLDAMSEMEAPLLPPGGHPAVKSVVNNIMKNGEKAKYEKLVAEALRLLQVKTNQNPIDLLTRALDMCAPLIKLQSAKRGSRRIQIPRPLTERARRRFAVLWIKQSADKKKGSFPVRFANEILLVLKGTSTALEKRTFVHKTALQNRANVR